MATTVRSLVAFFIFIYLLTYLTKSVSYQPQSIVFHVLPPKAKPIEPFAPQTPPGCGAFFIICQGK
jgi:hypothetical protein